MTKEEVELEVERVCNEKTKTGGSFYTGNDLSDAMIEMLRVGVSPVRVIFDLCELIEAFETDNRYLLSKETAYNLKVDMLVDQLAAVAQDRFLNRMFPYTEKGYSAAIAYLKDIGKADSVGTTCFSADGMSIIDEANRLYKKRSDDGLELSCK